MLLVFLCAERGSEDPRETSLVKRECRVSDPNVCSERFQVGRRDARVVPDSGFVTIELDARVDLKVVCQEVVHWFYRVWPDLSIDIIHISKNVFSFSNFRSCEWTAWMAACWPNEMSAGMKGPPLLATFCLCDIALDVIAPTSSVFNGRDCNFVVFDIFLFWVFRVFSLHLCVFLSLEYFFVSFQSFLRIYDFPFNWLRILLISV